MLDYGHQVRTFMALSSVSLASLSHSLQVRTIMVFKCISQLIPLQSPCASQSSPAFGLQVHLHSSLIEASKSII